MVSSLKEDGRSPGQALRARLSLRQIEAFCALAQSGSVTAAARRLSRTQSAVSMALQDLESSLGVALFERQGRRLGLSTTGRELLPHALELLDRTLEFAERAVAPDQAGGALALGASHTIGPFVAPALIGDFLKLRSRVRLSLAVANTHELIDRLRQHTLDCALIEGPVTDDQLVRRPWLDDTLCLFARAGHPIVAAVAAGARPAACLADAEWVMREPGSGTRELFLQAMASVLPQVRSQVQVNDPQAMKTLVMASDALGCLSRMAVTAELADGRLIEIAPPSRTVARSLRRVFWIVSHSQRHRSGLVDGFVRHALAWRPDSADRFRAQSSERPKKYKADR
jgi:DNA-binding transcriptional LysR family regulator